MVVASVEIKQTSILNSKDGSSLRQVSRILGKLFVAIPSSVQVSASVSYRLDATTRLNEDRGQRLAARLMRTQRYGLWLCQIMPIISLRIVPSLGEISLKSTIRRIAACGPFSNGRPFHK